MVILISIILVIIVLIIVGLLFRKRMYDKVDKLEAWKIDIMNRNIAEELSRMKELNLTGETEEKFELWRTRWDTIVTTELGDVEELLYDAEINTDRYRFKTANSVMAEIENQLHKIENDLDDILKELNKLLADEEASRKGIEQLKPKLNELRSYISKNRSDYLRVQERYDRQLKEYDGIVESYDSFIKEGEYAQAKEAVDNLSEQIDLLQDDIDTYPTLYKACSIQLPRQIKELSDGISEMKRDAYPLDHLNLDEEIASYEKRLQDGVKALEEVGVKDVQSIIDEVEAGLKEIYDVLEDEAIAKNYVVSKLPTFIKTLNEFNSQFQQTKTDVEELKKAYYIEDKDLERYLALEKTFNTLQTDCNQLTAQVDENKRAYTSLRSKLEGKIIALDETKEEFEQFLLRLEALRKDEREARENIENIRHQIAHLNRRIRRSNIPGVPDFIWSLLDEATAKSDRVLTHLDAEPIDISDVTKTLNEAQEAVDHATEQTDLIIEQAFLTERVIQYANRYRSASPELAEKLNQSEQHFRKSNYELALELAAKAVEEVEPGALKRIEEQIESVS